MTAGEKMAPIGPQKDTTFHNHSHHASGYELGSIRMRQAMMMVLWYLFSFGTIILNKHILTNLNTDAGLLGESQMLMSVVFGSIWMYFPTNCCCCCKSSSSHGSHHHHHNHNEGHKTHFFRNMLLLGFMRFAAVVLSLISLKYVAVSFSETIKSSAPMFTMIMAWIMLGERSGLYVNMSLLPIMGGLALCTATEISFNLIGFLSATLNNIMDCFQNVFSKKLLCGDHAYTPPELQFYTSIAALFVQLPFWFIFTDANAKLKGLDRNLVFLLLLNSLMFYMQSLTAYGLMSLISPVTFSVSNTFKRACLIWFSVLVFGNVVTPLSALGTIIVTCGVFLYQRARQYEHEKHLEEVLEKQVKHTNV